MMSPGRYSSDAIAPSDGKVSPAQARAWFPVTERLIYLNHAAISPLSTPARRAMEAFLHEAEHYGASNWKAWLERVAEARAAAASFIGARTEDMALLKNTTEGLCTIAQGLKWRPGDRVAIFECEFPANIYPWLALRRRGVEVELLPQAWLADLDRIREACRGTRVLSLSFVQYLSGFRSDLEAVGAVCRESNTVFVVDAIQGLGAFPLDVKRAGVHAMAADGHKWLTGPEGAAVLYISPELLEQIEPPEMGWFSVAALEDFGAASRLAETGGEPALRPGAGRLECGSLNTLGLVGLNAAIALLESVGGEAISAQILSLGEQLAQGLEALGCSILRLSDNPGSRSGITSFQHPKFPAESLVKALEAAGVVVSARGGWVRVSPHFYNNRDDVAAMLERLQAAMKAR